MRRVKSDLTKEDCKDAGLALVLIGLIAYGISPQPPVFALTLLCLLIAMTVPTVFRPFAKRWYGLSFVLGTLTAKVLLTLLFLFLVVPVGLTRRWLGKDVMRKKRWKSDGASVFRSREHEFSPEDLKHPY